MISYIKGDATEIVCDDQRPNNVLMHIVNNQGGWGRGFVVSISRKWVKPERVYRSQYRHFGLTLGTNQYIKVEQYLHVVNMIAQVSYGKYVHGRPHIDYDHLASCLKRISKKYNPATTTIHAPKIGSGLGGGDWNKIEDIINNYLGEYNVKIYVL